MGEKKWGWRDTRKGADGSGRWGHAARREVWWSAVKEEEDGEGKKKNLGASVWEFGGSREKEKIGRSTGGVSASESEWGKKVVRTVGGERRKWVGEGRWRRKWKREERGKIKK